MQSTSQKLLAQIHIAKKQLGLSDDEYRALLLQITNKTSSKDCSNAERKALLDHFAKCGFKKKRTLPSVGNNRMARLRKIEALLAEAKRPWDYIKPMVANLGKSDIRFCTEDDLSSLITMLVKDAQRNNRRTK